MLAKASKGVSSTRCATSSASDNILGVGVFFFVILSLFFSGQ
jgi:hypothetical protein